MGSESRRQAAGESKEEHGGPQIESRKGTEQMGVYCKRKYLGAWTKT